MLPISAADIIEFHPAAERATKARAALEEAQTDPNPNAVVIAAAEAAMADAEASLAARDPIYRLRVPTIRTKSASARDLVAEGVVTKGNSDLVAAMIGSPDEISPDDAVFLAGVKAAMGDSEAIPAADWSRVYGIARSVGASARILADRIHHGNMSRLHAIRHHLIIDGQRTPLPESAVDALPLDDAAAIAEKIESLMFPSEADAKN